jgi:hypothetical protein
MSSWDLVILVLALAVVAIPFVLMGTAGFHRTTRKNRRPPVGADAGSFQVWIAADGGGHCTPGDSGGSCDGGGGGSS